MNTKKKLMCRKPSQPSERSLDFAYAQNAIKGTETKEILELPTYP